jgi:D-alanyl-D-alanine carboxypeptidase
MAAMTHRMSALALATALGLGIPDAVVAQEQHPPIIVRETRIRTSAPPIPREEPPPAQTSIVARETQDSPIIPASLLPTRVTSAHGSWVIQLGAFPAEDQAKDRLSEAQTVGKALLANASSFTERVMKGRQELYRARFAGFDRNAAEAACSYFKRNDIECITVMAGH